MRPQLLDPLVLVLSLAAFLMRCRLRQVMCKLLVSIPSTPAHFDCCMPMVVTSTLTMPEHLDCCMIMAVKTS